MRKNWIILSVLLGLPALLAAQGSPKKGPVGISGWVIFWDQGHKSLADFERHAAQIDRAYFEWCHLTAAGMPEPIPDLTPDLQARALAAARANRVETWYMIGNWDNAIMDHNKAWVEKFLYDPKLRAQHIQWLITYAKQTGVKGIQIDYENLLAKDKSAFSQFMDELSKACRENGFYLGIAVPPKTDSVGTWDDPQSRDYGAIGKACDQFVPMTYDLHWSTSTAGAVTSPEWAEMVMKYSASVMIPNKLEVGYPAYGYDWIGNRGSSITWTDFEAACAKYHATPVRDTDYSQELHIKYKDEKGQVHEAWMPDSRCLEFQADIVKKYRLYGLGVWFFGSEDESFWTTMAKINGTSATTSNLPVSGEAQAATAKLRVLPILTDKQSVAYSYAYPMDGSKIAIVEKQGKRWVDASIKGTAWGGAGLGINRSNFTPYLAKGALQFYIRGAKGGENLSIGFVMDKGLGTDEKWGLENSLPMTNYAPITTQWTLVTIPLADFAPSGHHYDDKSGMQITGPFKWGQVIELTLDHAPSADPTLEVQMSSIRIVPSYDARDVNKEKAALQQ